MVELVEYALVVMASTLLVAGSAVVYSSFESYEQGLQLRGTFSDVAGVVETALQNGSATSTLSMPASVIGCEQGNLYVSVGPGSISQEIPARCEFVVSVGAGTHIVSFRTVSGQLALAVS
jgi:uncharacterized protein (UPF0333 family)